LSISRCGLNGEVAL